jgi:putative salt-induced outer membrane protein
MKKIVFLGLALLAAGLCAAQESAASPAAATEPAPAEVPAATVYAPVVTPVVLPDAAPAPPTEPTVAIPEPVAPRVQPYTGPALQPLQLEVRGRWQGDFQAGFSLAAGNTNNQSLNLAFDTAYERPEDKLTLMGNYVETRTREEEEGEPAARITSLQWRLGGRYDRNISEQDFGFIGEELSHDSDLDLNLRNVLSVGRGRHLYKDAENSFDVYSGLSWREDYYSGDGVEVDGQQRTRLSVFELMLGEESTHSISDTVRLRQKFVFYPGRIDGLGRGRRATLDGSLIVSLNKTLSLSMKLQGRYDSETPPGNKEYDLLFFTGLSFRFGH